MFIHGKKSRVYVSGYDIGQYLKTFSLTATVDTPEASRFGSSYKEYVVGLVDEVVTGDGYFKGSTYQSDYIFNQTFGSTCIWSFYQNGTTVGSQGYGTKSIQNTYKLTSPIDNVVAASVEAKSNVGIEQIKSLHAYQAESNSSYEIALDGIAATTRGAVGYLQMGVPTGGISAKVAIQHSAVGSTWDNLILFSSGAAASAQRNSTITTVKRYTRAQWTLSSTVGSATFNVGIKRM